jgi:phage tail-like protein
MTRSRPIRGTLAGRRRLDKHHRPIRAEQTRDHGWFFNGLLAAAPEGERESALEHRERESGMAVLRDRPYTQFNFLVDIGDGVTEGPSAGFQEVSAISTEVAVTEYRNGNSKENSVRKITGLNKATDVTLKRGIIGSLSLYQWLNDIRNGNQNALRTVTVQLQNEDHTEVVQTWKLLRARIIKHSSGPFNARSNEVAIEEIVLAYEWLELE